MENDIVSLEGNQYITRREASELFRVTTPTIDKMIKEGHFQAINVGRRKLITVESIIKFQNECTHLGNVQHA